MIKLPKKIAKTIENEFTSEYVVLKYIHIKSMFKQSCVHLVAFRTNQIKTINSITILRYFGDNSHSFLEGYYNQQEVVEEMAFQVKKLC